MNEEMFQNMQKDFENIDKGLQQFENDIKRMDRQFEHTLTARRTTVRDNLAEIAFEFLLKEVKELTPAVIQMIGKSTWILVDEVMKNRDKKKEDSGS